MLLTRQESSLSSSRRQAAATPPPENHHAKAIGCMSGIFQLFSKYQNPNKRLTFGKKQEKCKPPPSPRKAKSAEQPAKDSLSSAKSEKQILNKKRLSCDEINVPSRSPTIPSEIRRSNAANSSGSPRTPSSLVARLMGLEDMKVKSSAAFEEESVAEKRRRLLHALEKCNEDLESLKRIIKSVQSDNVRLQKPLITAAKRIECGGNVDSWDEKKCTEVAAAEERSPVCVLDEFTRSPVNNFTKVQNVAAGVVRAPVPQNRKPYTAAAKKPGEEDELSITKHLLCNYKNNADNIQSMSFQMRRQAAQPWSSRTMVQSVEEVCGDIAWGEKREVGRIGLVLQDHLWRDLIEDLVKELIMINSGNCIVNPVVVLPLQACKRRLSF